MQPRLALLSRLEGPLSESLSRSQRSLRCALHECLERAYFVEKFCLREALSALFYEFSIETHVPADHMLWAVDRFVDLAGIRQHLAPFYSSTGRPSVDPELMIRMLLVGYIMGMLRL